MDGRDKPAVDEMPNTQEGGLNNKTRLRIYLRKSIFGSKGRKPKKERNANMESVHVNYPSFLDVFTEVKVNYFKPIAKNRVLLRIVIFFEGWPIYTKVKFC